MGIIYSFLKSNLEHIIPYLKKIFYSIEIIEIPIL